MKQNKQNIYEKLIADQRFVAWVLKTGEEDNSYWEQWEEEHPEYLPVFKEACETVRMFRFAKVNPSPVEIDRQWEQAEQRMQTETKRLITPVVLGWYQRVAAILILPITIAALWFFYNQLQLEADFKRVANYHQEHQVQVEAPLGGQLVAELPDGSKAWLNSGSTLNYPAVFSREKREVEMSGEIYFQVAKGEEPFFVKNLGPTIQVHGTEFNVHAYENEENVTVALAEGKISLNSNGQQLEVIPGEVVTFNRASEQLDKQKDDIYPYTCWREGRYIFRNASLGSVLRTLERRYNVSIELRDGEELSHTKYNATISGEPLEQILELLTFTAPLDYKYKRAKILEDGSFSKAEVILWKNK
ncbi:FecR family protein [Sunxiuqinia rutila]|uniref:FecR family protein n=1 Tax=Sunxiuqinia rutila TaxID=1397841 RepID=UPI003D36A790